MPQRARASFWRWLLPLVLVVIAGGIATIVLTMMTRDEPVTPAVEPTASATSTRSPSTPTPDPSPTTSGTVAVLGDSFVVGYGGDSDYVSLMGQLLDVKTAAFGVVGTGLVNYGQGVPYDQRLASVLYTKPVGLVVQASVNDYETSTDAVVAAAKTLVAHAHSIDRDLPIAIVGPIYLDYELQPAILSQRAALEEFCDDEDITYVDPTGWITDATKATLIGPDNLHPTNAGYARIAQKMAAALRPWASDLP